MIDQATGNVKFSCHEIILCVIIINLTLLHSERPKLYTILAFLSAVGLNNEDCTCCTSENNVSL